MYKTIILDCQSMNGEISCGDCIAYRNCEITKQKGASQFTDSTITNC